jgi:hypothetical protein
MDILVKRQGYEDLASTISHLGSFTPLGKSACTSLA